MGFVPLSRATMGLRGDPGERPMRVGSVKPGSPAAAAGIQPGDRVRQADGQALTDFGAFLHWLRTKQPGDKVTIQIERDGQLIDYPVMLEPRDVTYSVR